MLSVRPLPSAALHIPTVVLKHKYLTKLSGEALQLVGWLKGKMGIISMYLIKQHNKNYIYPTSKLNTCQRRETKLSMKPSSVAPTHLYLYIICSIILS